MRTIEPVEGLVAIALDGLAGAPIGPVTSQLKPRTLR
jgi:hypothetical protein